MAGARRFRLRRPPPPPPEPPVSEAIVEEHEVGSPGPGPPWLRGLWFWLAILGAVVLVGLLILVLAELDDDESGGTRTATVATVPDLVGLDRDEAGAALADLGYGVTIAFEPNVAPEGQVLRQEPEAGAALEVGERVLLIVSAGEEP
jgi:hypothetical protein